MAYKEMEQGDGKLTEKSLPLDITPTAGGVSYWEDDKNVYVTINITYTRSSDGFFTINSANKLPALSREICFSITTGGLAATVGKLSVSGSLSIYSFNGSTNYLGTVCYPKA